VAVGKGVIAAVRPNSRGALVACSIWAFLLALPAPAAADPFARVADWILEALDQDDAPSLAVAVARDGAMLWAAGFGYADRERRVPATPDTRYSLASVTKPLTATGLMRLVERGLIDLDRPVGDYLPDTPLTLRAGAPGAVTVRRVASHMAGLPVHHHFFVEGERSPPPIAETIRRYGQILLPPGQRFRYSNLGYGLLGHIGARLTGQSYAAFMHAEVFAPLGMTRTSVGVGPDERHDYAVRYGTDGSRLPYYTFDHDGASAVFSSARDPVSYTHLTLPTKA
jgi:CubicO group peptidase (beta-lactamase class C family)